MHLLVPSVTSLIKSEDDTSKQPYSSINIYLEHDDNGGGNEDNDKVYEDSDNDDNDYNNANIIFSALAFKKTNITRQLKTHENVSKYNKNLLNEY